MNSQSFVAAQADVLSRWVDTVQGVSRGAWSSWRTLAEFAVGEQARWARHAGALTRDAAGSVARPAAAAVASSASAAPRRAVPIAADDLKKIAGIGAALEKKLNQAGITTYRQIAAWTADDVEAVERSIMSKSFTGRIRRDNWVTQARRLAKAQATG